MIHDNATDSKTIWQTVKDEDMALPEPSILIECYSDILCLQQGADCININYDTIPELIRVLKNSKRPS